MEKVKINRNRSQGLLLAAVNLAISPILGFQRKLAKFTLGRGQTTPVDQSREQLRSTSLPIEITTPFEVDGNGQDSAISVNSHRDRLIGLGQRDPRN